MAVILGLAVGVLLGVTLFGRDGAALGGVLGLVIGAIIANRRKRAADVPSGSGTAGASGTSNGVAGVALSSRVALLEARVAELERALDLRGPIAAEGPPEALAAMPASMPAVPIAPAVARDARDDAAIPEPATVPMTPVAVAAPPALAALAAPNPLWAWIVGGNTPARVGVLLLFIGVGFLLKYAVEHVQVPMSVRLAGVALGGIALLIVGWRLRVQRRTYAMVLQGGGVGVLYLTVFAALRLYALVPPVAAFALLVWISALSSWLAVRQDAISLAALAVVGGFLAPILTSAETGNHVMLFSYYALLNAGILGIAWFKAWRLLNLLGFVFTFLVGTFWGATRYRPEHFATTEPFLVLFFLFYVAIAVLYALRRSVGLRDYVDAGLVYGTPLVAAGLQSALVRDIEYGMAYSALAMSAVYLALGRFLYARARDDIRLLVESFLALGIVFATLAVPLGLDARWTSAVWAVEGAAILWAGIRQQRVLVRGFGLLLEFGAGVAFLLGLSLWAPHSAPAAIPVANSAFVGAVLIALAGLFSAWLLQRETDAVPANERGIAGIVLAWGALWWLYAWWREIDRWVPREMHTPAVVTLLAMTAVAFAVARRPLRWPMARTTAWLLLPALGVAALGAIAQVSHDADHVLAHGGWVAWPIAVGVVVALLYRFDHRDERDTDASPWSLDAWHAGLVWLVLLLVAHELAWAGGRVAYGHGAWNTVPWGLVPALGLAAVCSLAAGQRWPVGAHPRGYVIVGGAPVALFLALWSLAANLHVDGDPAPLPYVPLANPLDVTQAIMLVAGAMWALRARRVDPAVFDALPRGAIAALFGALAFVWINAMALRTIHFWYDVPYTPHALWRSPLVQATLSLLWSGIALATMAFANRRQWRTAWIAGAALLGVVVVKLFLVELSQVGTITRIVSFIGVGLLLLLIGYLAPVPPRRKEDSP